VRQNTISRRMLATGIAGISAALVLAGCGGGDISSTDSAATTDCGTMNLAVNPWAGYEASAAVVKYVAEKQLGCTVVEKDLKEEVSWQGFASGEVDVILEDWGHPELQAQYVDKEKKAVVVGPNGNEGLIGWYVPKWMAEKYPDITDWKNLNKYADLFKTSESDGKGQLLDGDPSYVSYDEALVKNLDLNYKVVLTGSEAALITAFRQAKEKQTPILGYFYEPQWLLTDLDLVRVSLPPWKDGCVADKQKAACDYEATVLNKVARTEFMNSGSPAAKLIKNFSWTNADQNSVALSIAGEKLSDEDAAKKWVDANPDKVKAWLA
jgi:glycine betaine/proline transport system substrate-binding protein